MHLTQVLPLPPTNEVDESIDLAVQGQVLAGAKKYMSRIADDLREGLAKDLNLLVNWSIIVDTDVASAVIAMSLLRVWARWLGHFSDSTIPYLLDRFIRRPGSIDRDEHGIVPSCLDLGGGFAVPYRAGDIVIADIGIPGDVLDAVDGPQIHLLTRASMRELITPRAADSHKGDYGRVLIVAGSRGKTGAAHLSAMGALRSGAGLVTVATPAGCQSTVASMAPEYMTEAIEEADNGLSAAAVDRILDMARDVVAIGPGLGQGSDTKAFVKAFVDRATMPLVIDADGLNAFGDDPERLSGREGRDVIITPHPGEMARLVGMSTDEVQASRLEIARNFAIAHHVYVVLKGHRTVIATPDDKIFINPTGNPGMATGGTGDVLTGMIAAWVAQLLDAEAACKLAVYLHGMAGDLADADEGEAAMTATDLAAHLGDAFLELSARRKVVDAGRES